MKKTSMFLVEGVDGCGKQTQSELLASALGAQKISFPRYGTPAAKRLEQYLHGEISLTPREAAVAFAEDRAAWAKEWREQGSPSVVLDRYVFSNFAYQGAKFADEREAASFVSWAKSYEYGELGLPIPDLMFYLVWEKKNWQALLASRGNAKHDGADIHESNLSYLEHVYDYGLKLAKEEGAQIVWCDGLSREAIHAKLMAGVNAFLKA